MLKSPVFSEFEKDQTVYFYYYDFQGLHIKRGKIITIKKIIKNESFIDNFKYGIRSLTTKDFKKIYEKRIYRNLKDLQKSLIDFVFTEENFDF